MPQRHRISLLQGGNRQRRIRLLDKVEYQVLPRRGVLSARFGREMRRRGKHLENEFLKA